MNDTTYKDSGFAQPEFTLVITSYFEEKTLEEFFARSLESLRALGRTFEIVMINDGSTDKTFEVIRRLYEEHSEVSVAIDFFKNSGQLAAMTAGICHARGRAIVFIDSDLQLNPEELPRLVEEFDRGNDLVSGRRIDRKDSWTRVVPSKLANVIMRRASHSTLTDFGCTFKIWDARVLKAFEFSPFRLFSTAEAVACVDRYAEVPVTHLPRAHGKSGWTFRKLWQFNMENLVNVSEAPFQVLAGIGAFGALLFVIRLLVELVVPIRVLPTVSNGLILNVVIVMTLILIAILALIGEFGIRNFLAARPTPRYIIRERLVRHLDSAPDLSDERGL